MIHLRKLNLETLDLDASEHRFVVTRLKDNEEIVGVCGTKKMDGESADRETYRYFGK